MIEEQEEDNQCQGCGNIICNPEPLTLTIFNSNTKPIELNFCSWGCVFEVIPEISCDFFVDLPYLKYDDGGGDVNDFLNLIKKP